MSLDHKTSSFPHGLDGFILDDQATEKSAAYTVQATTDNGKTFYVKSAVTFTLPALAIGTTFRFVNLAEDGLAALTISPNANDGICWTGAQTTDKDIINTAATHKEGDSVTLAALDQTVGWQVTEVRGTWDRET